MNLAGWDIVFAIAVDRVNSALAQQSTQLATKFDIKTPVVAKGSYGNWQIAKGGGGSILTMSVVIADGTFTQPGGDVPIKGGVLTLSIALSFLPTHPGGQELSLDFQKGVTFVSFDGVPALGPIASTALGTALAADLAAHAGQVTFVLASVSPIAPGGPTWLNPAALAFAYVEPQGGVPMLGIFAVTTARDITQLDRDIDPALIGSGGVGMAIAPNLFLQYLFGPALATSFGASSSSIIMSGAGTLVNNGDIALPNVSEAGETYSPIMTALSATLVDDRVNIAVSGACDMHMNITLTFNGSSSIGMGLDASGRLAFSAIGTPVFSKDVDIPWYDHLIAVVSLVGEGILLITVAAIGSELGDGVSNVAGTTALASEAPSIVGWVGSSGFVPTEAGLAGCLWMRGKIQ